MPTTTSTNKASGGDFVLSPVPPDTIFSPELFTAEECLMAGTAAKFSQGEVIPVQDRLDGKEDGLMVTLLRKAAALGLAAPDAPEEYGGLGLSKKMGARIQEMASGNGSFAVSIGVQSGIAQLPISLFGTKAQKEKYLPKLCNGEWIGAYALSEAGSGSDALAAATKAVLSADGSHYTLNGTKMWISNAKWAESFIVFAQVEGNKLTAFIVERSFPGVSVDREEHKLGQRGSSTARLVLDDAKIPAENVIYAVGKGHKVALNALNIGRFKLGAMALGSAREALRLSAIYAKERKQFGQPIGEFPLIQRKLAKMTTDYFASESILYRTADLVDQAFGRVDSKSPRLADDNAVAAQEFAIECSLTKIVCSETQAYICDEAIQVHGGYGFTEEFDVARHWRDARVSRIYEGTNEINRIFASARWLKPFLDDPDGRAKLVAALDAILEQPAPNDPESVRVGSVRMLTLHCAIQCLAAPDKAQAQEVLADMTDLLCKLYCMESVVARVTRLGTAVAQAVASVFTQTAYDDSLRLATSILMAIGADPHKREAYETTDLTDTLPLNRLIARATLDENGYPF